MQVCLLFTDCPPDSDDYLSQFLWKSYIKYIIMSSLIRHDMFNLTVILPIKRGPSVFVNVVGTLCSGKSDFSLLQTSPFQHLCHRCCKRSISFPTVDLKLSFLLTVHRNFVTEFWFGSSVAFLLVFKNSLCLGQCDEHFPYTFLTLSLHFLTTLPAQQCNFTYLVFFDRIVENNDLRTDINKTWGCPRCWRCILCCLGYDDIL